MLRARSFTTINLLKNFMEAEGISADAIAFFGTSLSGAHEIIYHDSGDGAASLLPGETPEDRAVIYRAKEARPMVATAITAAGSRTFTFDATAGTLTLSSGSLLSDGYAPRMVLGISGSAKNDGTYLISAVTATVLTIDASADSDTYDTEFTDEGPVSATTSLQGVPSGYSLNGQSFVHVVTFLPDGATSLDWSLYTWDSVSDSWALVTSVGTAGVVSVTDADADNPQRTIVEMPGVEKVLVVTSNLAGTFTTGYSAWLLGA